MAHREGKSRINPYCKTEDGSIGGQPSKDSSIATTANTVPAGKTADVFQAAAWTGQFRAEEYYWGSSRASR